MNEHEIKASLIMTAIQSIQYVADGDYFRNTTIDRPDLSEPERERLLAGISNQLTDPLFDQYRAEKKLSSELTAV